MKDKSYKKYIGAGLVSFMVIACSMLLFFCVFRAAGLRSALLQINHIFAPITWGVVIAYLLTPFCNWVRRLLYQYPFSKLKSDATARKLANSLAVLCSVIFAFALIYAFLAIVLPQIIISVKTFFASMTIYITTIQNWIERFLENNPEMESLVLSYYNSGVSSFQSWLAESVLPGMENTSSALDWLKESVLPNLTTMIEGVSSTVIALLSVFKDLFIGFIVAIYLLSCKGKLAAQSKKIIYAALPLKWSNLIIDETCRANKIFSGFISGKILDSFIIGLITLLAANLMNLPYASLIAVIIGVTNIIPFFGPFIGAIPSAFLILLVNPIQALYFVIYVLVIQQFDGNFLGPKILGNSTGLSGFWVLVSLLVAGGLFGAVGMLIGVPLFAILYSMVKRLTNYRIDQKGFPQDTGFYMEIKHLDVIESAPDAGPSHAVLPEDPSVLI